MTSSTKLSAARSSLDATSRAVASDAATLLSLIPAFDFPASPGSPSASASDDSSAARMARMKSRISLLSLMTVSIRIKPARMASCDSLDSRTRSSAECARFMVAS